VAGEPLFAYNASTIPDEALAFFRKVQTATLVAIIARLHGFTAVAELKQAD